MRDKRIFVKVGDKHIDVGYKLMYKQEGEMYAVYIPGFDIYYSAPTEKDVEMRSKAMIKTFMDYYIDENSWKQFFIKLHKLGFRTKMHDLTMKKLLRNKPQKASFSPNIDFKTPDYFKDQAKELVSNAQLDI